VRSCSRVYYITVVVGHGNDGLATDGVRCRLLSLPLLEDLIRMSSWEWPAKCWLIRPYGGSPDRYCTRLFVEA
jgi:hypothetical protein